MRVDIKYPFGFTDSPYYKYLLECPPKGVIYNSSIKKTGVITNSKKFRLFDNSKRVIKYVLERIPLPVPNAYIQKKDHSVDLIHCAHCLSIGKKPWVADIEFPSQMWGGVNLTRMRRSIVKKILISKSCKKILAWTEKVKREIIVEFPEIKEKVDVLYPAINYQKRRLTKHREINIIFSGRYFYAKGGLHALEVIDRLTKEYKEVRGIINSHIPEEVKKKYEKNKKIDFVGLIPQEKLFELYSKSDILLYPGYSDSFGFGFLEAMSFGLSIVTVDGASRKEIVSHGSTGLIVNRPNKVYPEKISDNEELIKELFEATKKVINDKRLREKFRKESIREVERGKFSIIRRNRDLKKFYNLALKD